MYNNPMTKKPRGMEAFKAMLEHNEFKEDLQHFRKLEEFTRIVNTPRMLLKYGVPSRFLDVLHHYIETNDVDYALVSSPVKVERIKNEGVVLKLSYDTTQPELKHFIETKFKSDIRPMLEEVAREPRKRLTVHNIKRDQAIYVDYLERKPSGQWLVALSMQYSLSKSTIARIIKRMESDVKK